VGRHWNTAFHGFGILSTAADQGVDLTSWNHWRQPAVSAAISDIVGPVLVTVEYHVDAPRVPEFIETMHEYGRVRRRDGASRWGISRDLENADRYLETFVVSSWAEHLRQHDRLTRADSELEVRLRQAPAVNPVFDPFYIYKVCELNRWPIYS
jgi:hypothetical protein